MQPVHSCDFFGPQELPSFNHVRVPVPNPFEDFFGPFSRHQRKTDKISFAGKAFGNFLHAWFLLCKSTPHVHSAKTKEKKLKFKEVLYHHFKNNMFFGCSAGYHINESMIQNMISRFEHIIAKNIRELPEHFSPTEKPCNSSTPFENLLLSVLTW